MIQQECKQKDIDLSIGKDKLVISRELKRNCDGHSREYKADLASVNTKRGRKTRRNILVSHWK